MYEKLNFALFAKSIGVPLLKQYTQDLNIKKQEKIIYIYNNKIKKFSIVTLTTTL